MGFIIWVSAQTFIAVSSLAIFAANIAVVSSPCMIAGYSLFVVIVSYWGNWSPLTPPTLPTPNLR